MATGDIGAVIDTLTFDAVHGYQPSLVHVAGDIYAVAYQGPDNDGWIKTFEIDAAGEIGAATISSREFDAAHCAEPCLIHVSGTVFAVAYQGFEEDGWLATVTINAAGTISAVVDSFELDVQTGTHFRILKIADTVIAGVFRHYNFNNLEIFSIGIDAAGNIDAGKIDSLEVGDGFVPDPDIVHVTGTIYAIAYRSDASTGKLCTINITAAGLIDAAVIDTTEFEAGDCNLFKLECYGSVVVVVYPLIADGDGWMKTATVDALGNISAAAIDSFEFDTVLCAVPDILYIADNIFAVAYPGGLHPGALQTIEVDAAGNITEPAVDTAQFAAFCGNDVSILKVAANVYAIAYGGSDATGEYGAVCTIAIEDTAADSRQIMMGML
jgi:hypothetical protein